MTWAIFRNRLLSGLLAFGLAGVQAQAQTSVTAPAVGTARPTARAASLTDATCSDSVFTTQSGCIVVPIGGNSAMSVQGTGTWTGTNNVEITSWIASANLGTPTWRPLNVSPTNNTTQVTTFTANGDWFGTAIGTYVRVRRSTASSGTAIVAVVLTQGGGAGGGASGGGGGGAVTVSDGGDVALGSTTDTAVTGDADGTLIGHVRYLDKVAADVWNSTNHGLKVEFDATPTVNLGTANVTNLGTFSVQLTGATNNINNIAGTISLPTGAASAANQSTEITSLQLIDDLPLAQASTTSGQKGVLIQGAVTTSAPSYTNAQTSPLSLDTSGNLRVVISGGGSNAAAGSTGSAVPSSADYVGLNVGGTLRGGTGVNPTGSVYAQQFDIASIAGSVPSQTAYVPMRLTDGTNYITPSTDATTNTTTQSSGPQTFFNGSAATPTAVGADNRSIAGWSDTVGRLHITGDASMSKLLVTPDANSTFDLNKIAGNTPSTGNGATSSTGSLRVTIGNDSTGVLAPVPTAVSSNGLTTFYYPSAASTNSQSVKSSAGNLYAIHVTNTTTTNYFLRLYNSSSAPTCSSNAGFVETVPALGAAANGGVNGRAFAMPQAFSTGIGFCITGGGADNDNTNAAVGVYVTLEYR